MTTSEDTAVFDENFAQGLALGDRWHYVEVPGFVSDDGEVSTSTTGMSVAPPARNPDTGEPMFTKDASGFAGHLKWIVLSADTVAAGDGPVRVTFRAAAECFGTAAHPYGDAVADAATDFRLGAATLNVLDFETGIVFDFWLTSTTIVPYYERIRPPGVPYEYEAFGAVVAPVARRAADVHDLTIVVDAAAGTARWEIDGAVVAAVESIGMSPAASAWSTAAPAPWTTVLHHGGEPELVHPGRFQIGMGLMTLLDAALPPSPLGLVDVGMPTTIPAEFAATGPALFGQGVRLTVERITVHRD